MKPNPRKCPIRGRYLRERKYSSHNLNVQSGTEKIRLADNSEKIRLTEELIYIKGFLASVEKKLSNRNFIENAPKQIVSNEKKKVSDAKEKIKILERSLAAL